uniref:GYF domain-containing protein n=1 Tax=Anabas testudineus TaxID=64144 RepID=A0A7N6FBI8_ANATE
MAETQTLNFGPEWLRALSGGGGGSGGSSNAVVSPPLSPAMPKYKLAEYRYGREEMLALYVKDNKIPIDLHDKEFLPILQEEPLPPLALVSFTEEEQRNFSMSVNSAAVLRLTGRGGGPIAGAPRGRSTSRGRGRGRGDGGFYQRSFDDVEGFGRGGREMHRSQSWEERGDRRFEKPGRKEPVRGNYEDGGAGLPRKHDFTRSESENWRTSRDDQNGEDDEGGWRLAGSRRDSDRWCPPSPDGPRSAGWREHPDQRRRFPFDAREDERGYRRPRSGSGSLEDERDSLPEWCLEDADEEAGTFDSSGAFLSLKKASKEPILEEAELDFRPLEECEEGLEEEEDSQPNETKETEAEAKREVDRKVSAPSPSIQLPLQKPMEVPVAMNNPLPFPSNVLAPIGRPTTVSHDTDEDEGLKHFEQEAEKMVAYLQDGVVDDDRLAAKTSEKPKPAGLPLTHEAALKWFYKDPQGEMQGPFSNHEMTEWFQAGYFTMSLLVKRGCDEVFQPLGEIMKIWGRVPFTPGPAPPPLQVLCLNMFLTVIIQQMELERREAEMRAKREEEERKRLEALRARQEEERKRLEEEERARQIQVRHLKHISHSNSLSGRANKKVEEEEKLLKLFQGVNKSQQDTFMQWCEQTLHTLNTANNLDVPTFASFLKEVDSPYEVHDYVRAYLGDTPEAKDFAKQFLERRAKQNGNQQKQVPQNQQQALKQQQVSRLITYIRFSIRKPNA